MIARTWRCIVSSENAPHYVEHFEKSILPELNGITGFHEAYIMRRPVDDAVELTVMTLWSSMGAIHSFAGEDVDVAVVAPVVDTIVHSYDKTVTHYEIILNSERNAQ